jgi:hypothetical protein
MIAVRLSEVSLALATVALLIAVLSLYLGNLKRADIRMIWLSERDQSLRDHQRRDEGPPIFAALPFSVVVINSGSRPYYSGGSSLAGGRHCVAASTGSVDLSCAGIDTSA